MFKEIGYLSPLIYKTKVKMNNNETEEYLFHEMPTLEMKRQQEKQWNISLSNKNGGTNLRQNFIKEEV